MLPDSAISPGDWPPAHRPRAEALLQELLQGLAARLHALRLMRHHRHLDLAILALADQAADRRLAQQDLHERHAAAPARGQELLREDGAEDIGDLCAHDALLLLRVEALDAPHGLRRAARVQRAEHEHARLGCHERRRHRLAVAYLADEQDVRHLPQRAPQGLRERLEVAPEFALADKAPGWRKDVLDGIF